MLFQTALAKTQITSYSLFFLPSIIAYPAQFTLCCFSACSAAFSLLRDTRAFFSLSKHRILFTGFSDWQAPSLQQVRSSGQGAVVRKLHAIHERLSRATCVPRDTKGPLSYKFDISLECESDNRCVADSEVTIVIDPTEGQDIQSS